MPWTPAQRNAPVDPFQAAETDRLNAIAHGRRLDEQSLMQDRYDKRFAADAVLQGRREITDRKHQLTDQETARTNALEDRAAIHGFMDGDTYVPGFNAQGQAYAQDRQAKAKKKSDRQSRIRSYDDATVRYEANAKRLDDLKKEQARNDLDIRNTATRVFHNDGTFGSSPAQEQRTKSFIMGHMGRNLTPEEQAQVNANLARAHQHGVTSTGNPAYNKYTIDAYKWAIDQVEATRNSIRRGADPNSVVTPGSADHLPSQLDAQIEQAKVRILTEGSESQHFNALKTREKQIAAEIQTLLQARTQHPGADPRRNRRNRQAANPGASLGPISQAPPPPGPSGPMHSGPPVDPSASLALSGGMTEEQFKASPLNRSPKPGDNTQAGMDAGMQYLNDQGIDIVSYAGGTVKVDKMPVAGTPDSGGQIMYLLNVDNYMTMPTGGSEQDMGVSSPEEVEEFKYRVSEALKESNLPPRISDLLYHSLGPADTEGQARGFFDPNSHRTSPPLSPGVDPAGNTPNTFTPPPPVTPNANPAAPMPALPAPAGGDDPAFDAVFGPALDQEKRRRDEINRQIRDRDTTHYKEYDVD